MLIFSILALGLVACIHDLLRFPAVCDIPGVGVKIVIGRGGDTGATNINPTKVKKGLVRLNAECKLVQSFRDFGGDFQVWLWPAAM